MPVSGAVWRVVSVRFRGEVRLDEAAVSELHHILISGSQEPAIWMAALPLILSERGAVKNKEPSR